MYILAIILLLIFAVGFEILTDKSWVKPIIIIVTAIAFIAVTIVIDYDSQTTDTEVWSGSIIHVEHKEEWDEWHEPYDTTYTDSDGKVHTKHHPGYWEHHNAENYIETSDEGSIYVDNSPDGKIYNDSWPNSTEELEKMWTIGSPSASVHTYVNKVQASYSIYKHDIDLKQFPNLPEYPKNVRDYIYIDRFIGNVPNKNKVLKNLADWNKELNKFIPDPERPGKKRSWKQVNIIFVNLGDVPSTYGFALQDYWQGGNKNDFIVSFGADSDMNIKWAYPFSWADNESSEMLKIETRDLLLNQKQIKDWLPVIDKVGQLVADKFERKQFANFNYLKIEVSSNAMIFVWVIVMLGAACVIFIRKDNFLAYGNW